MRFVSYSFFTLAANINPRRQSEEMEYWKPQAA